MENTMLKKAHVLCILSALLSSLAFSRESISFNFDWKFKKGDHPGAEHVEYKEDGWREVQVPHDWSIEGPFSEENSLAPSEENFTKWVVWVKGGANGYLPTGIGWYRKKFGVPPRFKYKKVFIEFEGIYRNATIWLNGQLLNDWVDVDPITNPILDNPQNVKDDFEDSVKKAREGAKGGKARMYNPDDYDTTKNWVSGYVPLVIDITNHLNKEGKNIIVVRCDARLREGWWYEGAGIYRDVRLLATENIHVSKWGTYVTTPDISSERAVVNMETSIDNDGKSSSQCEVITTLFSQDGVRVASATTQASISAGKKGLVRQNFSVLRPTLWSIDNPYMYKAISEIKVEGKLVDTYETPFGIRTFHFDPRLGFFLNSKHYSLDGVCNHDCIAPLGVAVPDRVHYEGIKFLRDARGKFYRAAHNPRTNTELDACDKYGIVVANESRYFDNTDFATKMVQEYVKYSRNHPSIMMWSLGNEEEKVQGQPRGVEIARDLMKTIRELDDTRAIAVAQNRKVNWPGGFSDMFDVLGCNWRDAPDMAEDHEKYPKRAVYVSEYNYGGTTWDSFAKLKNIAGSAMWAGFDYRGEGSWPGVWWPGWIGDNMHYPSKNFWLAQCQWSEKPAISFTEHKWTGKPGEHVKIRGVSNCDEVIAYLGDKELQRIPMPHRPNKSGYYSVADCSFDFDVKFQPGKNIRVVGKKSGYPGTVEATLKPLGRAVKILLEPSSDTLKSDGEDVSIVKISLVDENNNLVRRGQDNQQLAKEISLTVNGAGYLLATANGAKNGDFPGVTSSLAGGNPWTHNGYCQAIIRSNGQEGKVSITASAVDGSVKARTVVVFATKDADPTHVDIAKAQPFSGDTSSTGGFVFSNLNLPQENVKADVSTGFDVMVENTGSLYPLEVAVILNGEETGREKYSIERGGKRIVRVDGPRLYKGGKHNLKVVFSGNGKVVKTITKTLKVTETPVAFHVDTTTIPTAVFVGEEFRFSAQVRNTGSVSATGTEVPLQLHTHRQKGPTVELKPGETKEASFSVKFPADAVANQEYLLKIGSSSKILKVINPIARPDDFEVIGQVSHVSGKDSTKALRFDGKESSLKIKKGVDLKDKLFTICVWFKQENEKDSWDHDMGILSGEHDGFRAGMNKGKDPYWSFRNHRKWRHPKPKKGEWIMHTYQLKGRFLPRQTGGQLQDDGTLSDVQEETTTDMSLMLYHNDRREGGHHINDNTFVQGSIDHIGSFLGKDHFMGDIDDIKVYDRSLRFEEIKQIYDEGLTKYPSIRDGLVFWLDCEDDSFGTMNQ